MPPPVLWEDGEGQPTPSEGLAAARELFWSSVCSQRAPTLPWSEVILRSPEPPAPLPASCGNGTGCEQGFEDSLPDERQSLLKEWDRSLTEEEM